MIWWSQESSKFSDKDESIDYPDMIVLSYEDAVMHLFDKISDFMERKFSNYYNADIKQECFLMMLCRYRNKGIFAKDKPWLDNEKMWWSFAKKSCLYIIREFKQMVSDTDIFDIEDTKYDLDPNLMVSEKYNIGESDAFVKDLYTTIYRLYNSKDLGEERMGQFAMCKAQGMTDKESANYMGISMPRIYEIKKALKNYFNLRFGNVI